MIGGLMKIPFYRFNNWLTMDTSDTESNSTYEDNSGNYLEYVLRLCVIGIVLDSATYISTYCQFF